MNSSMLKLVSLIIVSMALNACSVNKEVKTAPSSKEDLGFMLMGVSAQEAQDSGLSYRVVNKKHKLVEIYSTENKIEKAFPGIKYEKNQMDAKYIQSEKVDPVDPNQEIKDFIGDCKKGESLTLQIKNKNMDIIKDPLSQVPTANLGDDLEVEAVQLDGAISEETQYIWILSTVGLVQYDQFLYSGKNFKLKLQGMGEYQISLVAKDKNDHCGIAPYVLWVTSNTPLLTQNNTNSSIPKNPYVQHLEKAGLMSDKSEREEKVITAVIDTGVNYNHSELNSQMYRNLGEIPNNGLDDDENGFVDDYSGFDFFSGDPHPMDDTGHGSHVAGLIAGFESGITNNTLILPLKVGSGSGIDSASIAGAILYAVDQGAKVINVSLGGHKKPTDIEILAYEYANDNDVIVVAASGNGHPKFGFGLSLDRLPLYPASLDLENIIAVAASSNNPGLLATYSNFGSAVDIVAPGGEQNDPLYSTAMINNLGLDYIGKNGTSMAAPIVAGAIAEILSINPKLTSQEVKSIITDSGTLDRRLNSLTSNAKVLNIDAAIKLAEAL